MASSQLFLIDANALCYRSFFAIKNLTASNGQATNAVYGFVKTIKALLKDYNPEYMAICFDLGRKTHRQEKFAEYKIQRPSMPDDLVSQIPIIKDVLSAYKLSVFEKEGYEADDLIATLAKKASSEGCEVVIVSDDKDMLQLLNEKVCVFSARKEMMIDEEKAQEDLGFNPQKMIDFIGLAGDSSDNIPGVKGIGKVSAKQLINEFGTLEGVYENVENVKSKSVRAKLIDGKDSAYLSKELAVLEYDVPIEFTMNDLRVQDPDKDQLKTFFRDLDFRRFFDELNKDSDTDEQIVLTCLKTSKDKDALLKQINKEKKIAFFVQENEDIVPEFASGITFSCDGKDVYFLPTEEMSLLEEIFSSKDIVKITHNIKEAFPVLLKNGINIEGNIFDSMLAGYLLSPSQSSFDFASLAWEHLKKAVSDKEGVARKAVILCSLYEKLIKELKEKELCDLFEKFELPLALVLSVMETEGVNIDKKCLAKLSVDCDKRITELHDRLFELSGESFNLNSPKQLSKVLFEKLKLPVIKKTKTGFSTNEEVLKKLSSQHPLPALILDYRQLAKLKSTYIDALPKLINADTGHVHTSFNQTGTETGRLSSNNPNLQNIPIRTEFGRQIRKAFIPHDSRDLLISADYSQIELRFLAHLSEDENLIKAFHEGIDIHSFTAALIFDVEEDDIDYQKRAVAKRVNFGITYGMSAFGLAKDLEISIMEAQTFIDKYFLRYPKVKSFMDNEIKKAEDNGYVLTMFNRRRYIPEINSNNMGVRQFAQRQAINTPVQGSAADLIKLAMINVYNEMQSKKLSSTMIITVHDELVFNVKEDEKDLMKKLIRDKMENAVQLSVPIQVTVKSGKNWLELKEF